MTFPRCSPRWKMSFSTTFTSLSPVNFARNLRASFFLRFGRKRTSARTVFSFSLSSAVFFFLLFLSPFFLSPCRSTSAFSPSPPTPSAATGGVVTADGFSSSPLLSTRRLPRSGSNLRTSFSESFLFSSSFSINTFTLSTEAMTSQPGVWRQTGDHSK